jgi:dUTP pyrophosphatase
MSRIEVPYQLLDGGKPPYKASTHAAGYDLYAAIEKPILMYPQDRQLIPCGIKLAIPVGYEGQIRPRSGLAIKHGITVLNAPGTIDADYRGEIGVCLINLGRDMYSVEPGTRIAQLVIAPVPAVRLVEVDRLDETERGSGGFGSTGET